MPTLVPCPTGRVSPYPAPRLQSSWKTEQRLITGFQPQGRVDEGPAELAKGSDLCPTPPPKTNKQWCCTRRPATIAEKDDNVTDWNRPWPSMRR